MGRIRRTVRWHASAPAERLTLPAAAAFYGAAAGVCAAHVPPLDILGLTAGAAGLAFGSTVSRRHDSRRAGRAALVTAAAGCWACAAAQWGLTAGPDGFMSLLYAGGAGTWYGLLRLDEHVRERRSWRAACAAWHRDAPHLGLHGSHLLEREGTRLGEAMLVDVTGTGRRASQLAGPALAERIAEREMLPPSRVRVNADRIAGRLRISIRRQDPWAAPIPHPLLDADPETPLPERQSVTGPLVVGMDPETGRLLEVRLWDEDGAKSLMVVAIKGGGKTVLLNNLTERLTACGDAVVWGINVSKAKEDRKWAPACGLAATGPKERAKAVAILRAAHKVVDYRGAQLDGGAVFRPTAADPLIIVKIDEIDALVTPGDALAAAARYELGYLQSKGRSEGVAVIAAGQRGTAQWFGGGDIRVLFDLFAILKVQRQGEMHNAAGELGLLLPDMASYGEGHGGVVAFADLSGDHAIGRTFFLKELDDIERLTEGRTPVPLGPGVAEFLGDAYARLRGQAVAHPRPDTPPVWESTLDADLESEMAPDLREAMARNEETKRYLEEFAGKTLPQVPDGHEGLAAMAGQMRRTQAAAEVVIPPSDRQRLLTLLAGGTSVRQAAASLEVAPTTMWRYLDRLRLEGIAETRGKGRAARWHRRDAA